MNTRYEVFPRLLANRLHHADSLAWMTNVPDNCVDFILTDPPYIQRYHDRDGRRICNDDNDAWVEPAFNEAFRILRPGRFLVCWYSWRQAERFFAAWRAAGFRPVGHFVAPKPYASARVFVEHRHEQACLLAKGQPARPTRRIADVLPWRYTRNIWHPTQKPLCALVPLITAFSRPGEVVFDPFAGSASTLVGAYLHERQYCGIELDERYYTLAQRRLLRMTRFKRSLAA
jgi:site-specific DNA-methyltransferase (adenine-specific)